MASVFFVALFAHFTAPAPIAALEPAPQDLSCYRLMAALAQDEDPRVSSAGLTGAQYFLGRIDARAPGFDPDVQDVAAEDTEDGLLDRCSAQMSSGGRDFRTAGERLVRARDTI